jgi:hypothetical protein
MAEPLFDPTTGKARDMDRLHSITIDGRAGTRRKVTDESTPQARITRVESDTERSVNITPYTVDLGKED